jgi:hypothetical protein
MTFATTRGKILSDFLSVNADLNRRYFTFRQPSTF